MAANRSILRDKRCERRSPLRARSSGKETTPGMRFHAQWQFRKLLALAAWTVFSAAAQAPPPERAERQVVAPGVTYDHLRRTGPAGEPWSIHVIEVNRHEKSVCLKAVQGRESEGAMQRELPTAMAARAAARGEEVLAVVNGDYDLAVPHMGIPDGLSITSGRMWTTGKPNWPVLGITEKGEPIIDVPSVEIALEAGKSRWSITALNKPLGAVYGSGPRAFTSDFGPSVESAQPLSAVILLRLSPSPPLRAGKTARGRVDSVLSTGRVSLPNDLLAVVHPHSAAPAEGALSPATLRPGQRVKLRVRVRLGKSEKVREAIGGFPILVRDGRVSLTGTPSEYLRRRHPRTAVCYNASKVIFVVVDGRQPQLSVGMTLEELAELMVSLGCTVAINTDGGGSSVMAVTSPVVSAQPSRSGNAQTKLQIVNSPSDGAERGRGNAWVVVRKR